MTDRTDNDDEHVINPRDNFDYSLTRFTNDYDGADGFYVGVPRQRSVFPTLQQILERLGSLVPAQVPRLHHDLFHMFTADGAYAGCRRKCPTWPLIN
jgi:hypothetical protein